MPGKKYQRLPNLRPESDFINDEEYQKNARLKNLHSNFIADSVTGVAAGANITALYAGVEAVKFFLSGLSALIVFPIFILLDLLDLRNSWTIFFKIKAANDGKWKGSRNAFARAILTSALVPLSIFVIVGSFIPGFLPGIAIALSFTAIMASRSIFNLGSGAFNLGRSQVDENPQKEMHAIQSRIQLGVGASNMLSLAATISVFLLGGLGLATFGFAPIGIAAGIALIGILSYAAYKAYQSRKEVSAKMTEMRTVDVEEPAESRRGSKRASQAAELSHDRRASQRARVESVKDEGDVPAPSPGNTAKLDTSGLPDNTGNFVEAGASLAATAGTTFSQQPSITSSEPRPDPTSTPTYTYT